MTVAAGTPSVTGEGAPAATPPNPPTQPTQPTTPAAQSDDPEALKAKLDLALKDRTEQGQKNARMAEELAETRKQLDELNRRIASGQTAQLEEQGQFKQLWEDAKATIQQRDQRIADLEAELATERTTTAAERLKGQALATLSSHDAIAPEQLYGLLQPNLREMAGKPVVLAGGIEQPLEVYVAALRAPNSGYDHHFRPTGRSGMGTEPGAPPSAAPGTENPWKTGNITQQLLMVRDQPELAQVLQAEAAKG
jgi:hypothetical protein